MDFTPIAGLMGVLAVAVIYTETRINASRKRQQANVDTGDDWQSTYIDAAAVGRSLGDVGSTKSEVKENVVTGDSGERDNSGAPVEDIQVTQYSTKDSKPVAIAGEAGVPIQGLVHSVDESDRQGSNG